MYICMLLGILFKDSAEKTAPSPSLKVSFRVALVELSKTFATWEPQKKQMKKLKSMSN